MEYIKNERTGKSLTGDAELDKKVTSDNFKKLLKQWSVADDKLEDPATVVEAIKKRQGEVNVNRDGILGPKTFSKLPSDERNILTGGQEAKAEAPVAPAPPAAVPPEAAPTPAAVPEVTPPPAEAVPDLSIFDKLNKKENFYILTFSAAGIEGAATVNQEAADKASMKEGEIVYLEKGKVESGKHETVTIVDSKGKTHEIDSSNLKTIISPVESKIQREINQYKIARFRESSLGEKFTRLNSIKTEDIKKLNNGNLVHIVNNKGLNQTDVANLFNGTLQSVDKNRLTNAEENEIFSALVTAYETQKTSIQ